MAGGPPPASLAHSSGWGAPRDGVSTLGGRKAARDVPRVAGVLGTRSNRLFKVASMFRSQGSAGRFMVFFLDRRLSLLGLGTCL